MSKLAAALLTITILFGVASSTRPLVNVLNKLIPLQTSEKGTRQDGCVFPTTYPKSCNDAAIALSKLVVNAFANLEAIDPDAFNSALGDYCTMECISPQVEYYRCSDQQELADYVNSAYCGQNSGSYCTVSWTAGISDNSVIFTSCLQGSTCESSCQSSLQRTADYLGCCAASLYNNTISPYSNLISPQDFATCDISLGQMCPGLVSGAEVNRLGFALLTIVAAFAALINSLV